MDGSQDRLDSEILRTGNGFLTLLREKLCPEYVRDGDLIMFATPWEEADYRVGIYLYDIQDYSVMATAETVINDTERRFPPKAVELSYLIFCNEAHRFGGVRRDQVQIMLNQVIRILYDHPYMEEEGGDTVGLSFLRENTDFKIRLWGSFNKPLQPAVYIKAAPVLITSERKRSAGKVRERDYNVGMGADPQQEEMKLEIGKTVSVHKANRND